MGKTRLTNLICFIFLLASCADPGSKNNMSGNNSSEIENGYLPSKNAALMEVKNYVHWVQDAQHGFRKEKAIGDLTFSAQFKPFEYIVCLEEKKNELADSLVRLMVSELNEMQYYDLKITLNKSEGELLKYKLTSAQQYTDRVNYFAFGLQNDIQLIEGSDTLPCTLYHFERTFDASPACILLLGFPIDRHKVPADKTLVLYDRTFNSGLIKFTFSKDQLKKLPKLKTL